MLTAVLGSALMDYAMHGRVATAQGNDDPTKVVQGCFPCRGERGWVTISIATEDAWLRLCEVLGHPDWTREPRFVDPDQRRQHRQEIQEFLAQWTRSRTKFEVTHQLQAAGIAAGPVLSAKELFDDVHLQERGFFEVCTHPEAGTHPYYGRPMQFSKTSLRNHRPAPCFGEHNRYVFGKLLGLSEAEMIDLTREGIVSEHPLVPMGE
jgi:crotonobetainyl-CoA:carnitine CoA-transferase CaiB-like acyl-CoA transferase